MAGLQWSDVFAKGNAAGVAVGQPGNAQNLPATATMWEVFYRYRVSDNISVTPALFYVSNNQAFSGASSNVGGVIQTKFTF
jgi:carbohydrate-selective porin OprB